MAQKKKRQKKRDGTRTKQEGNGDGQDFISLNLSSGAKRTIFSVFFIVLALIFTLGFFEQAGSLGVFLTKIIGRMFGFLGKFFAPIVSLFIAFVLVRKKKTSFYVTKIFGIIIAFIAILGLLHLPFPIEEMRAEAFAGHGGGLLGYVVASAFVAVMGKIASVILLLATIIISGIIAFNMSFVGAADKIRTPRVPEKKISLRFFGRKKSLDDREDTVEDDNHNDDEEDQEDEDDASLDLAGFDDDDVDDIAVASSAVSAQQSDDHRTTERSRKSVSSKNMHKKPASSQTGEEWQLPPLRLLGAGGGKAKGGDVNARAQVIQDTFANFGIDMELEDIVTGPTVTQFSFRPPRGVKLTKILALSADLALALAAHPIRIEAPIPGKSLVGIEVPNKETAMVRLRDIINTDDFDQPEKKLLLALGEDVNGDYVIEDLATMPHLLVAGATGAGKSVAINSILLSLLYKNTPQELKMILVDPKRVELSLYNGIPHLLSDVITDNGKVLNAMKWAANEMERRYKLLQQTGVRDLASYNKKRHAGEKVSIPNPETQEMEEKDMENLPAIIIVIDEMADLMGTHGKEVEAVIVRLAQMSRAVGIHLILSTQRPSVEVITGTIKANLPTRIALRVATNIDSRTIIDMPGAEKLVGHGDMLFTGPTSPSPHRLQGVYVSEEEVKKVIAFIKRQARTQGAYDLDEDFSGTESSVGEGSTTGIVAVDFDNVATTASTIGADNTDQDPMLEEAKTTVIEAGKASTSYLQRRLRVGYSRAARLMDELEDQGIIGPAEGAKPRKVLASPHTQEETPLPEDHADAPKDVDGEKDARDDDEEEW